MPDPCQIQRCQKTAGAFLGSRALCQEHFIAACYAELKGLSDRLELERFRDVAVESAGSFVQECVQQASALARKAQDLENLEQARLIDILFWGTELGRRLRRSPRKAASIRVRLRCDRPGHAWEEETQTVMLSQYGALVACQHRVEAGETLSVARLDIGREAQARVAWILHREPGPMQIGIEFLETGNFWELDWKTIETAEA